jgi:hypothetical protein
LSEAIFGHCRILRIAPGEGWVSLQLKELYAFRELLYFLIWRDVKVRYKQTALGAAWAIIQPFFRHAGVQPVLRPAGEDAVRRAARIRCLPTAALVPVDVLLPRRLSTGVGRPGGEWESDPEGVLSAAGDSGGRGGGRGGGFRAGVRRRRC